MEYYSCIKHVNLALKIENMTLPLKDLGFNQRVFRMKPATLDFWSANKCACQPAPKLEITLWYLWKITIFDG